jgi:hypothetical protein
MTIAIQGVDHILQRLARAFGLETFSLGRPRWLAHRIQQPQDDSTTIDGYWWSVVTSHESTGGVCLASLNTSSSYRAICCSTEADGPTKPVDIDESDDLVAVALRSLDCFPAKMKLTTGFDGGTTYVIFACTWRTCAQFLVTLGPADEAVGITRAVNIFARDVLIRQGAPLESYQWMVSR